MYNPTLRKLLKLLNATHLNYKDIDWLKMNYIYIMYIQIIYNKISNIIYNKTISNRNWGGNINSHQSIIALFQGNDSEKLSSDGKMFSHIF
jgi:hypothetical protein